MYAAEIGSLGRHAAADRSRSRCQRAKCIRLHGVDVVGFRSSQGSPAARSWRASEHCSPGAAGRALIIAAFTNPSAEVVRLLLAKGAKVDVMDQRHVTPLNAATFGNDTATVRLLLEAGADIDTPDTFIGLTPLMNAAGNRNLEAVKLLWRKAPR